MGGSPSECKRNHSLSQLALISKKEETLARLFPDSPSLPRSDESETEASSGFASDFTDSERSMRPTHKKTVSFNSLFVREYSLVVGDHPCCAHGMPLSLGWHFEEHEMPVDHYEATRPPRRQRADLRTSSEERRIVLSEQNDEQELKRAERKLYRSRSCSAKLCEKANEAFFN
jgi:hypothetical protein